MTDWWDDKYGPDHRDVAEEKRRAIADDPPWNDDEIASYGDWGTDHEIEEP